MYVRDARNRDEAWLLDHIEAMGLDETAFRSRDYVIAVDEESNARAGFGRIRIHADEDQEVCELTSIGVLDGWRGQGVGAHVVERLIDSAEAKGFDHVYSLTSSHEYLAQFGFEGVSPDELPEMLQDRLEQKKESLDPEAVPMRIGTDEFSMPADLREAFKVAAEDEPDTGPEETPEDFGIDPDEATYKYDTS
ncbi:GNAT family N-acetyltransferase [Natronomonas salina]|uniref:GNAT family N-acetyltransferase n=1 Tax=Natronomonas salina TaxID=1710540 RepID=UPI0015B5BC72|nr:GNAT family N-acetyltransferase [Natronomonas salina]QLD88743.1 GNAT family N-acetyltransferase [Natronomonas salina]